MAIHYSHTTLYVLGVFLKSLRKQNFKKKHEKQQNGIIGDFEGLMLIFFFFLSLNILFLEQVFGHHHHYHYQRHFMFKSTRWAESQSLSPPTVLGKLLNLIVPHCLNLCGHQIS